MSAQGRGSRKMGGGLVWMVAFAAIVVAGLRLGFPESVSEPSGSLAPARGAVAQARTGAPEEAAPSLPPGASADWWSRASAAIDAREYEVTASALGPQAPNRAQGLRTYFREGGIEVVPRASGSSAWSWRWHTTRWGRPRALAALAPTPPTVDAMRVEYRRTPLTEWYENGPDGIEQGFSLAERPAGLGSVCIEGAISGSLRPALAEAGCAVDFLTADGCRVLRYDELKVVDARGQELPSSLDLADGVITIRIDDREAVYPILIDPILTTPEWTEEPDHPSARFGQIVSTAGDVNGDGHSDLLVSAPGADYGLANSGRVFVYYGSSSGLPAVANWWKSGDQINSFFGQKAGTAGDVNGDGFDDVIISSQNYSNGQALEGRAWIFYGSATGLSTTAAWDVEGDQVNAYCGYSVGCAGDVNGDGIADVFVGVEGYSHGQTDEGVVWVFHGGAGGIDETADWTGEANDANCGFGWSASGAGDVNGDGYDDLVVGAPAYENPSGKYGRVFIFYGAAGGLGNAPWTCEPSTNSEGYAKAVAGAGDVNGDGYADVLVGAPEYTGDLALEGKVYLHFGSATGPPSPATWSVEGNQIGCSYGLAMATAGDVNGDGYADFLVGAEGYDAAVLNGGKAYLYLGRSSNPFTIPSWTVEGDQAEAKYGCSVATAGDVDGDGLSEIVVGAPDYDHGEIDEGQAYLYLGAADPPTLVFSLLLDTDQEYARGGNSIAAAGDVNADGFSDVLVGASSYDNGEVDEGVIFLFLGGPQGMASSPVWYAEGNQAQAYLGECVASAGDVNGDGLDDILAGAPWYDRGQTDEGAAFVWHSLVGSAPTGNPANASWTGESNQPDARYGYSVAPAGDVNGDGYADVIVGAHDYDDGQVDEGAAFVYHGSAAGLSGVWDWYRDADIADANFGFSVSSAGDFNGDGYSDVIVGAYTYDHPTNEEGLASVYQGSADGLTNGAPFWYAQGDQASAWLGRCVACAGDVDADGYSDIIIGVPQLSTPNPNGGKALVWLGGPTAPPSGTPSNADWSVLRLRDGARLGWCVGSAGDVNGDGYSDVLVSTPYQGGTGDSWGIAFLWFGSASGVAPGTDWMVEGLTEYTGFANRSAGVGDVNGDGFDDVMIGAAYWDGGETDEGAIFLHYGNNGRGLGRAPMQWQNDALNPIAPLGWSEEETRFALRGIARTAAGRGTVRMVWEVKEFLDPFDGTGTGSGSWWDTGTPVSPGGSRVTIFRHVSGLDPGMYYHWRMRFEAKNPFFPRTKWLYLAGNAPGEADLRTGGANSGLPAPPSAAAIVRLGPCSPNPFAERTSIRYALSAAGPVRLTLHDVQGRQVAVLVDDAMHAAGEHAVDWDGRAASGRAVPAGVYFCRIEASGVVRAERVLVAR